MNFGFIFHKINTLRNNKYHYQGPLALCFLFSPQEIRVLEEEGKIEQSCKAGEGR